MPAGVTWTEHEGGFSLLLTLPAGLDAAVLLERAAARGVIFTPGNAFFVDGGGERMLRLSFSALPLAQIDEGIRRLADTIREVQRQPEPVGLVAAPAVPLV
jgi:DNA-binding transcriptional MocR family regulator